MFTTLYINFSDAQGQITVELVAVSGRNELIQAFMHVIVTCKNEDDRFKNEGARVFTRFLPLSLWGIFQMPKGSFFRYSRAVNSAVLGPIWPNLELFRDVIDVLVT